MMNNIKPQLVDDKGAVGIISHIVIRDADTKEVFVSQRDNLISNDVLVTSNGKSS